MDYSKWDKLEDYDSDSEQIIKTEENEIFKLKLLGDEEIKNKNYTKAVSYYQNVLHLINEKNEKNKIDINFNKDDLQILHHVSRIFLSSHLNLSYSYLQLKNYHLSFQSSYKVQSILSSLYPFSISLLEDIPYFFLITKLRCIFFLFSSLSSSTSNLTLHEIESSLSLLNEYEELISFCSSSSFKNKFKEEGIEFSFEEEDKKEYIKIFNKTKRLEKDLLIVKEKKKIKLIHTKLNDVLYHFLLKDYQEVLQKITYILEEDTEDNKERDLENEPNSIGQYKLLYYYLLLLTHGEIYKSKNIENEENNEYERKILKKNVVNSFKNILTELKPQLKLQDSYLNNTENIQLDPFYIFCKSLRSAMEFKVIDDIMKVFLQEILEFFLFYQQNYLTNSIKNFYQNNKNNNIINIQDFLFLFLGENINYSSDDQKILKKILSEEDYSLLINDTLLFSPAFYQNSIFNSSLNYVFLIDSLLLTFFKLEKNWYECRDLLKYIIKFSSLLLNLVEREKKIIQEIENKEELVEKNQFYEEILSKISSLELLLIKKMSHYLSRLSNIYKVIASGDLKNLPEIQEIISETFFIPLSFFNISPSLQECLKFDGRTEKKKSIGHILCLQEAATLLERKELDSSDLWKTCGEFFNSHYGIFPYVKNPSDISHEIAEWGHEIWKNYQKILEKKDKIEIEQRKNLQQEKNEENNFINIQTKVDRIMGYYFSALCICSGGNIEEFNSLGELNLLYAVSLIREIRLEISEKKGVEPEELLYLFFDINYHLAKLLLHRKKVTDAEEEISICENYIEEINNKNKQIKLNDPKKNDLRERKKKLFYLKTLILCSKNKYDEAKIFLDNNKKDFFLLPTEEKEDEDFAYIYNIIDKKLKINPENQIKVKANLPRSEYKKILLQKEEKRKNYYLQEQKRLQKIKQEKLLNDRKLINRLKKIFIIEGEIDRTLIFSISILVLFFSSIIYYLFSIDFS